MKKCFYFMLVCILTTLTNTFSFAQIPVQAQTWKPGDKVERFDANPQRKQTQTTAPQNQTRQPEQVRQAPPPPKRQKETWRFDGYYTLSSTGGVSRVLVNRSNFEQFVEYDPNSEYFSSNAFGGKLSRSGNFVATGSSFFTKLESGSGYLDEKKFNYSVSGLDGKGLPVTISYFGTRK